MVLFDEDPITVKHTRSLFSNESMLIVYILADPHHDVEFPLSQRHLLPRTRQSVSHHHSRGAHAPSRRPTLSSRHVDATGQKRTAGSRRHARVA